MARPVDEGWAEILNPDAMRTKFIMTGLFMVAHEMLLYSIKGRLLAFYADDWCNGEPVPSDGYKNKVLALDPKNKNDALRGSIAWLRNGSAIDKYDEDTIRKVTDVRNAIAHELGNIIFDNNMPDLVQHFPKIVELVAKIDRWWIINLEDVNEEDEIMSGQILGIQALYQVALGDEKEAWELYRAFMKRNADRQPR